MGGGVKILNFSIFFVLGGGGGGGGGSEKLIFLGYDVFVDNFGGHRKTDLFLGIISMHLGLFLWSRYKMGIFFEGC